LISDEKVNHKRGYKIFAAWLTFRTFNLVFYCVINNTYENNFNSQQDNLELQMFPRQID